MGPMLLTEIDHVAIAVRDLDAAIDYYAKAFGATVAHREIVDSDGVEEALIKVADSYIQLTAATRDDSPIAKSIEKRGEGLHHVGYRVDDCKAALAQVVAAGGTAIDQEPRPGSRVTTVAFVHPKGSFGTLIELVQAYLPVRSPASAPRGGPEVPSFTPAAPTGSGRRGGRADRPGVDRGDDMNSMQPGWYPDPFGRFARRYHDGRAWTEHVADQQGTQLRDAAPVS